MKSELVSLLSDEDISVLNTDLNTNGYDPIEKIRSSILTNNHKYTDLTCIDVDLLIAIDLRIDYPIFITEDDVFIRDEIIDKFNFCDFGIEPEQIFNRQCIEVIDNDYTIYDPEIRKSKSDRIYNTQIYIGKERWKDYIVMYRFRRSLNLVNEIKKTIKNNNDESKNKDNEYITKLFE